VNPDCPAPASRLHHRQRRGLFACNPRLLAAGIAFALPGGVAPAAVAAPDGAAKFFLQDGDRVCFYGDSITDQRFYCAEVETYALTRFPHLHVRYVDSGVGGDSVTGGWAGPINLRLKRDVFPYKPNVVTIMLGMNDARYQPFKQTIFNVYKNGYEHIIASLKRHLPGVRIVLLATSPYDDITHKPKFPGGYNAVLIRYDKFVKRLARKNHLMYVDFNRPMVAVLKKAWKLNPALARQFFPGRIHPSAAAQMMMAQTLLKAWGAPATVSNVSINATTGKPVQEINTRVTAIQLSNGGVTWTQLDNSLPMPVLGLHENWPQFPTFNLFRTPQANPHYTNAAAALINKLSGFTHQLDREMLTVQGLTAPRYQLRIDGKNIGIFSSAKLAQGVNLSAYFTPMLRQAYHVSNIVWEEMQAHFVGRYDIQTMLENFDPWWTKPHPPNLPVTTENDPAVAHAVTRIVRSIYHLETAIVVREYAASKPLPHHYQLIPAGK
jgi:lysophospholipase L1-like esterase